MTGSAKRTALLAVVFAGMALSPAWAAKDSLVLGMVLEPPHLDPTAGAAAAIREVTYANIFEGLTRIDRNSAVKPALAESWTVSPDGLTYTFTLRKGVTFHDGTPFTSADVAFSLKRAMAPDSTNAQKQLFEPIDAVDTPDPATVVVRLKRPTGLFLYNMGWGDAVVMSEKSAGDAKTNPVGTGPFKFTRWSKGDRIEMEKYPAHWNAANIRLAKATFRIIPDPQAQVAALRAGDIDAMPNIGASESIDQFRKDPRFTVSIGNTEGETILAMNNKKKPFDDVRVRRAIAHAVDKRAIIEGAMNGFGTPIGSHFSPSHPAYIDLVDLYKYDPATSRRLLKDAGVENLQVTLRLPPPAYARRGGELVAAMLQEVGIQATIQPLEWAQWLDQVFRRTDYDLTIVSHTEPLDIGIYARDTYYFNYDNPAFKELIRKAAEERDDGVRNGLYQQAQRMLADDSVNVFMFMLPKLGVWNAKLKGMWDNVPIPANDLTEVYWVD